MVSPNIHICRKDQRRTPQRRWCHCVIFNLTISQSCSCFVRGTIVRIWVFRKVTIFNASSIKIMSWKRITSSWILGSSPYAVIMFRKLISVHAFDYTRLESFYYSIIPWWYGPVIEKVQNTHEKPEIGSSLTACTTFATRSVIIQTYRISFEISWFSIEFYQMAATKHRWRIRGIRKEQFIKWTGTFK